MSKVTGVVSRMNSRPAGTGVVHSISVNDVWYGGMWDKPACNEGDTVTFTASQNGNYWNVAKNSLSVVEASAGASTSTAASGGRTAPPNQTQTKIEWQAARNSALTLVNIALTHGSLTLPTKAAQRYDALLAAVDEVTVRFMQDTSDVGASVNRISGGAEMSEYNPTIEE